MRSVVSRGAVALLLLWRSAQTQSSAPEAGATVPSGTPGLAVRTAGDRSQDVTLAVIAMSAGQPVRELQTAQLSVRVGEHVLAGEEVQVDAPPRLPASLLIVLDGVNTSHEDLMRAEDGLRAFLLERDGHLTGPTSVALVSDHKLVEDASGQAGEQRDVSKRELYVRRLPETMDGLALARGLAGSDPGLRRITAAQGSAGQEEQVSLSLKAVAFVADAEAKVPGAKLVVWISPGWPLLAGSAGGRQQLFDTVTYFSSSLRRAGMVLSHLDPRTVTRLLSPNAQGAVPTRPGFGGGDQHALGAALPSGPEYWKTFAAPVTTAREANPNDLALQVLAVQSGGLVLGGDRQMQAQLDRCSGEAQGLHLLSFAPTGTAKRGSYQAVSVRAGDRELRLRTRPGYYEDR